MKIFKKEKLNNGRRHIYFCGVKICSYTSKHKNIDVIKWMRSLGVVMGDNNRFVIYPNKWDLPNLGSEPFLIEIGNNNLFSFGITFLTHDASVHTCKQYIDKKEHKDFLVWKKIKIGNNNFIGCHTIIMPGITIGDNCVIGAGSLVTKNIPSGEVWAGNPAKFIRKTSELANKLLEYTKSDEMLNIRTEFKEKYDDIFQKLNKRK